MNVAAVLAVPWVAAAALAPFDGRRLWARWAAVAALAGTVIVLVLLGARVASGGPVDQVAGGWPAGVGITLRADPLGILFALVSTTLLLACLVHEVTGSVQERSFPPLVLFLAAGLNGLFLTGDMFTFYVFFEVCMTSAFVLATYGTGRQQIRAALTFTAVNLLGSAILLSAIALFYRVTGTLEMAGISEQLTEARPSSALLIGVLVFVAFGVKLGFFPFHFWLPAVYRGAYPVVAAVLSGVIANIGGYGLLRFGGGLLLPELRLAQPVLVLLGGASILYGGVLAVSRREPAEVFAYSSISQAGFIVLGLSTGEPAGFAAAIVYSLLNALNKTLLFLTVGLRGSLAGWAFAMGALSVAGVPPAAGFLAKAGLFRVGAELGRPVLSVLVFAGGALSFVYMFQLYQRTVWAEQRDEGEKRRGPRLVVAVLALAVVALGLWPEPLLSAGERAAAMMGRAVP